MAVDRGFPEVTKTLLDPNSVPEGERERFVLRFFFFFGGEEEREGRWRLVPIFQNASSFFCLLPSHSLRFIESIKKSVDLLDTRGIGAVSMACRSDRLELLEILLKNGANPNVT